MMSVHKLRRRPQHFLRFSGLDVLQFDRLLRQVTPALPGFHQQRLARANRQRRVGGGPQFRLPAEDQLLLALCWTRLYLTNELLGYLFGLDASNISRNRRLLWPLLSEHLPVPVQPRRELAGRAPCEPPRRRKRIATLEELFEQYPDLKEVIVDATEQAVQRPSKKRVQKKHYSRKKKRHTRKTQLTTLPNGMIAHLSKSVPGSVHDYKLFHRSGVDRVVPAEYGLRVDKGYQGIKRGYEHREVQIPRRASKLHPLTPVQKRENRRLASQRVVVEHTIARIKKYGVIGQTFRHRITEYDPVMRVVCGLVNLRTHDRLTATI
jgi:IS5 family transposase